LKKVKLGLDQQKIDFEQREIAPKTRPEATIKTQQFKSVEKIRIVCASVKLEKTR